MPRKGRKTKRDASQKATYVLAKPIPKRNIQPRQDVIQIEESEEKDVKFERETYKPETGYDSDRMQVFRRYLNNSGVDRKFQQILKNLIDRPEIPYNPYPSFVSGFSQEAKRYHMTQDTEDKITTLLSRTLHKTSNQHLCCIEGSDFGWGLPAIVRATSPRHLQKYKWMVDDITPKEFYSQDGYTNQVMIGLTGPAVFEGIFYPETHTVELRMEHLVSGTDMKKGVQVYAESVMATIDKMTVNISKHQMLNVQIPLYPWQEIKPPDTPDNNVDKKTNKKESNKKDTKTDKTNDNVEPEADEKEEEEEVDLVNKNNYKEINTWSITRVHEERAIFVQAVYDATMAGKYIYADCVLSLDDKKQMYTTGQLRFSLSFLQVAENGKEEKVNHFSDVPMATLHEGIFMKRLHADQYLSTFLPPDPEPEETSSNYYGTTASYNQMRGMKTNNSKTNAKPSQQRRRVHTDGFRYLDDDAYGPYGKHTAGAVRQYLQKKLAGHHVHAELCEAAHTALLLYMMDRTLPLKEHYIEIYNLLNGTFGRLFMIIDQLKNLQGIVVGISNSPNMPVIRRYLDSCKDSVNSVFDSSVHVMSTEETSVGRAVAANIDDFITDENFKILTVLNVYSMEKMLGEQRWYCMPLLQSLAGSCLPYCPALINLIDRVRRDHPNAARFSTTLQREKPDPTGFSIDPKATHGVEHSNLANLRHEKLVINMEFCMETSTNAPKSIAAEGVLLQYMVDTHLDNIWHSYLTQLMTEPYFPSNPYPELVSFFRQQAMKMDLFFTTEREVIKPLFASEVIIDDPDNFIYTISGVDCYGVLSALQVLDTATFMPLSQSLQPFFTENFTMKKGPFKVAICLAMSGPCILYGKMQPYLTEVELHEHFFVQGPPGCSSDVVRLCALIVGKSVNELIKKNETAVSGVYLGNERWSFADISTRLDAFVKSFVYSMSRKQPAYLMGFIVLDEWRFVTVKKYYLIRYVTEEGKRGKLFYPENPLEIYQSVFFSSEKAAFFYQNCGLPYNGDPMGDANIQAVTGEMDSLIITAMVHSDWLNVHRFLLLKCLMKQKLPINSDELENEDLNLTEYIDSKGLDHVTEAWFILQSIAALIEYIISLANTLQDLLPLYQDSELYSVRIETMLKNLEPPEEEIDKKKKKKKKNQVPEPPVRKLPEQFIEDFKFTVDEAAYGKMTMVFHKKLLEICQAKIVMASFAFDEYVESKLNECLQEDATYNNLYLIYDVQTLQRLDEIKSMLHALQDSLAYDVHLISPEAIKFFNNIKASDLKRKTHLSSRVSEKSYSSSQKQRTPRSALSFDLAPVNSIRAGKTFGGFVDDRPDTFGDPFRALTPFDYNIPDMSEKERKQKEKEKKKKKSKKPEERVFLLTPVEDNSQEDL